MKILKLVLCGALLFCLALIGCNKEETAKVPTLVVGDYFLTKAADSDCSDVSNNIEEVVNCDGEDGCWAIQIKANQVAAIGYYYSDEDLDWEYGTYTATADKVTFDFTAYGFGDVWKGSVMDDNQFQITFFDEDVECISLLEFTK